jgi:hypothetical protein
VRLPEGCAVVDIVHPSHIISHMNAVQQGFAVNRCIVVLRTAVEDLK